ncbi:hypothetical protein WJX72_007879 [[Myrmecia] bisecta]|uniref:BSD domain-containing protein n=1 Tax=[Myrmecia] bisecta TaxID=41462 RepID=A0AAW1R819_9CHLO
MALDPGADEERDTPLLVKRCMCMLPDKRKVPGVLTLSRLHIQWLPNNPATAQPLKLATSSIAGALQRAKGKPMVRIPTVPDAAIFELECEADRDAVVELLQPVVAQVQAKGKQVAGAAPRLHQGPDAARKQALLTEHKDLGAVYQQLVLSGLLTEAEFWASRMHLLRAGPPGGTRQQRSGISSAMLAAGQPTADGRVDRVTFQLTPDIMRQIFMEKPHVQRAYQDNVPHKLTEKEFFQRYFKHQLVKQMEQRRQAAGGAPAHSAEDEDELFSQRQGDAEQLQREASARIKRVDPTVNVAADTYDALGEGFGLPGKESGASTQQAAPNSLFQDLNRHGAVVLDGAGDVLLANQATATEVAEAIERARQARQASARNGSGGASSSQQAWQRRAGSALEDLRSAATGDWAELNIKDPRRYFDTASASAGGTPAAAQTPAAGGPGGGDRQSVLAGLRQAEAQGRPDPIIPPRAAAEVLQELSQAEARQDELAAAAETSLLAPMQASLRQTAMTCNELLRHFWSCFPANTAARQDKATRLQKALTDQYRTTETMVGQAIGTDRTMISGLMRPVQQALDAAFDKYDGEQAQWRASKRHAAMPATQPISQRPTLPA